MFKVYLAGPITGLSYDSAADWRKDFIEMMPDEIWAMSPLRGKSYLQGIECFEKSYNKHVMSTPRGIMTRDHYDSMNCDVIVANFYGSEKVSIGTAMEIAWAYAYRVPVVAIMESEGNPHDHPMINEAIGYKVDSLEQAAHVTKAILLPVDH